MRLLALLLFILLPITVQAQLTERILGANHPELEWKEIYTEHFILTFHEGLETTASNAAPIAEEVYRVVTTNLETPLKKRLRIYLSNTDEVKNAFAVNDEYIYIWMRGILDDEPFAIRASGTSKWLRSVITHEFTHIVIEHATRDWTSSLLPISLSVPRWFHEGMARYMEPDGWTSDLDIALRMAVVSGNLNLDADHFLGGTLLYEGGQSLVRYIASEYGDSSLRKIVKYRSGRTYDFDVAVQEATKHSLNELFEKWRKAMIVYYGTQYGTKQDIAKIGRKIPTGLAIVLAARLAPDGKRLAIIGKADEDDPSRVYIIDNDTSGRRETISTESGIAPYLSWSSDGKSLLVSKLHWGADGAMLYDIYRLDVSDGALTRLTTNERAEQPDWASDGSIVAVKSHLSGSDLIVMKSDGSNPQQITKFNDVDVDVYWPRWSPDSKEIAFSIFRKNGKRDIAVITLATRQIRYMTDDSINDRYAVWSPHGDSLFFVSFSSGIPNGYVMTSAATGSSAKHQITDLASNLTPWEWSSSKDSVLVSSFELRNSVPLYWIGLKAKTTRDSLHFDDSSYTRWRFVHWPLVTRPADSLPATTVSGPFAYNSLANIRPLLYFPLIGTDLTRTGEEGTQWGAGTLLRDDMGKHTLFGYALYGDVSKQISYEIEYKNSQLRPDILLGAARTMGFDQVIADQEYYERETAYHVDLHLSLPTPDDLDASHEIAIGAEYLKTEPWNLQNFDTVTIEHRPIAAKTISLIAKYDYFSNGLQTGLTAVHFDRKLGSDLTRTRIRGFLNYAIPLGDDYENELGFVTHAAADFGDELPQDFLGFQKYDEFEGGLNLIDLHAADRIRGVRRYYYGNRLLYGAFEIRHRDPLFGSILPLLKAFEPRLVEWIETGAAWYANAPSNHVNVAITSLGKANWLSSAGIELRTEGVFGFALSGGVGWELKSRPVPDWYFRLAGDL
jgi:hypothetical protein